MESGCLSVFFGDLLCAEVGDGSTRRGGCPSSRRPEGLGSQSSSARAHSTICAEDGRPSTTAGDSSQPMLA